MTIGTHTTRKVLAILATMTAAAVCAPGALADPPQGHRAAGAEPDLVERYVASGRGQADLVERWVDGRAGTGQPDLVERYAAIRGRVGFPDARPDGYQSQLRAERSASPELGRSEDGFHWADAGIGALAGFVLSLIAGGMLVAARGRGRLAHS
jgi:hypothetical protein